MLHITIKLTQGPLGLRRNELTYIFLHVRAKMQYISSRFDILYIPQILRYNHIIINFGILIRFYYLRSKELVKKYL